MKINIMNNNNNKIYKFIISLSICFVLIFSNFIFSFADNDIYDFSSYELNYIGDRNDPDYRDLLIGNATYILTDGSYDTYYGNYSQVSYEYPASTIYYFKAGSYIYFVSLELTGISYISFNNESQTWGSASSYTTNSSITENNITYRYYRISYSSNKTYTSMFEFDTLSEGVIELQRYLDNPAETIPDPYPALFALPAGNVAYIRVADNNTLTLNQTFPEYSKWGGTLGTYWTNTQEIAYGVSSLPGSNTSFPLSSGMGNISWHKSEDGTDLLGRTKEAYYTNNIGSSSNYIVIYNPTYRELTTSGQGNINPTISIYNTALIDVIIYPLSGKVTSQGTVESYSVDNYTTSYTATSSPDNDNIIPESTDGKTPSVGGSGSITGGNTISDYIHSIENTLSNFVNNLLELIQAPISHIQQLISAGTGFMSGLRGLYSWLPADIQSIVISALTVCIGIAVFKVFL